MRNPFASTKLTASSAAAMAHPEDRDQTPPPLEINEKAAYRVDEGTSSDSDDEPVHKDAQGGVQDVEAMANVWSWTQLIAAYIMIWLILFVVSLQQSIGNSLAVYVTSDFQKQSLLAATSIMSSIIGGLTKLPLAKILDIWGRPQGIALTLFLMILGLIMIAGCNNIETYAAAQVFYWVGHNGLDYSIDVFIADTSALKNRALMFAFSTSPYLITTWIGGPAATSFLKGAGWRWGYGVFAIVLPIVSAPFLALIIFNYRKAKKMGVKPRRENNRSVVQSIIHYAIEFDVVGILLIAGGLALFLLPFSLYSYQKEGWKSPMIICMIIFGGLLIIAFAFYEKYLAPVTFIPFELLVDRTVLGSCVLAATTFVSYFIWDNYFLSFLQVVNNLSVTDASYIGNTYTMGSCFWSFIVGAAIRLSGRFKWCALYFGVPMQILGVGLMIHFRQPDVNIGYIVMCQIFIAVAGGTTVICQQMAVMAAAKHQHVAVVLAVQNMFSSIGGAIGSTVAGAIWTGVFPVALVKYLPAASQADLPSIYASIVAQRSYPVGSPTRDGINRAYGDAQKYMLIAATAILSIAIVAVAVWRDIKVKDFKQVKGRVI